MHKLNSHDVKNIKLWNGLIQQQKSNIINVYRSSDGKTVKIEYKGKVEKTINDLLGGIRSTCTYVNAENLKDYLKCTTFVRVNNQVNKIYS